MEDYKSYLNEDAGERERQSAARVMEGLQGLRLEAKVEAVKTERAERRRRRRIGYLIGVLAMALLAGIAYRLAWRQPATPPSMPQQQQQPPPMQAPTPPDSLRIDPTPPPSSQQPPPPIAQLKPDELLPEPQYPAPDVAMIRGGDAAGKGRKALLDQLWYTGYPLEGLKISSPFEKADESLRKRDFTAAYLELERLEGQLPPNDTLRYLKGYCLLEMGEGEEAETYFSALESPAAAWAPQLDWYRGLSKLLADKPDEAVALFRRMAGKAGHPYQLHSRKALRLLGEM
jgi:hypothetical protein